VIDLTSAMPEGGLEDLPGAILNPRRRATRVAAGHPRASAAQERASIIAMYFAPNSQAPITLLELGLFARSGRLVVCCPEGYWRKGNVDVVCATYGAPQVPDLGALIAHVRGVLA
jgi:hypothetical protein